MLIYYLCLAHQWRLEPFLTGEQQNHANLHLQLPPPTPSASYIFLLTKTHDNCTTTFKVDTWAQVKIDKIITNAVGPLVPQF
jgi:hypothetical protein